MARQALQGRRADLVGDDFTDEAGMEAARSSAAGPARAEVSAASRRRCGPG